MGVQALAQGGGRRDPDGCARNAPKQRVQGGGADGSVESRASSQFTQALGYKPSCWTTLDATGLRSANPAARLA